MRRSVGAIAILLVLTVVPRLSAAAVPQDTSRAAPARDTLEAVVVRAVRAGGATATSQTTVERAAIKRTYSGQDAPLALIGLPSVTVSSDAGTFSGYSSLRLRGLDQSRVAISVDGVPLNDPEDQVLYFSNVPDFLSSMESVRLQRGVGSSAFGTAAYAGSLDFESLRLAATPRFAELQLTTGSWGTQRVSLEGATGLRGPLAGYLRVSGHETDGYRRNSGNLSRSAFTSVGWFRSKDALKFSGFAGRSKMHLAYYAPSEADLAADRRVNVMSPEERDDFTQSMASLQYTRVLADGAMFTATVYRNAAGGNYDVRVGADLWNFNLDHEWHGLLATASWSRGPLDLAAGAHVSSYDRDHFLYVRPDLASRVYDNTGFKQEQSTFVKATWTRGAIDWTADLQLRRAAFRYRPTAGTGIGEPSTAWVFANPRVGLAWRARPPLTVYASLGRSGREPSRTDLFAGADDLDAATAAQVLPLDRVRPESVTDLEVGARVDRGAYSFSSNLFAMAFRDEIAPTGALAITGSPLRRNVPRSLRAGMEFEGAWHASTRLTFSGNVTWMHARIAEYDDLSAGATYRDVPPLLTPAVTANLAGRWRALDGLDLDLSVRHVSRSQLANDGDRALVLPPHTLVDAMAARTLGPMRLRIEVRNVLDAIAHSSGYTDGTTRYFFPIASRSLMATLVIPF